MTDRLPIVDGAPACPFVAFEDDRDGRATAPDHRHRCFAEPRPAPRALAHQEAYCLSSAFPVCPTFQDWARREAAAARQPAADDRSVPEEPPVSQPMPPREREPRHAPETDTPPPPLPPRRNQPRGWAAPPPWSAEDAAAAGTGAAAAAGGASVAWSDTGAASEVPPPAFLAPRTPSREDDWGAASRGLAGSAAHLLAGSGDDEPPPATPSRSTGSGSAGVGPDVDDDAAWAQRSPRDEWPSPPPKGAPVATASAGSGHPPSRRPTSPAARREQARRQRDAEAEELFGPAWEKPRRYEAYPTLRTRVGLPNLSSMGIAVAALALAGVVLFFVGPMLLGFGSKSPDTGGGATPSAGIVASASPNPTLPPAPTPQVYVVLKNDNMSKIARKFGVTLEQLMAANPQIKNPNRIKAGDEITIPVPVSGESAAP